MANNSQEQTHPQWARDRQIVNRLLQEAPSDFNLAECGRLRIRYQGFPGGRDIQRDLDQLLTQWGLTEAELFAKTRAIHNQPQPLYQAQRVKREDWT